MIKAVLIDDEKNALEMLEWQLQTYCPQVHIIELCNNADHGINAIQKHAPQLVFLDIEMPHKNGFEVILHFPEPGFDVIFTTAYDQFALKAFKFAALDYLLKPIEAEELITAVQRYEKKQHRLGFKEQLEILLQQYKQPQQIPAKLPFTTLEGIVFVKPESIVHCESFRNYTTLFFNDKSKLTISKTLKEVEELLLPYSFFRVHQSHLINLQQVSRYVKAEGGYIEMSNQAQIPISRQRKDLVLETLMKKP
ncbi:MAG: LytTR family DNA-binding domain-containing protein [Bacteroidota bacterium]|nr:LytTR family DNA-binding domain-containing protein [Bacteroidota bacterium]